MINYYGETRYPFLKTVRYDILLGLLLTTKALKKLYYPTNKVPKSKLVVWLLLESMIYLEWSTEVACISIESLTRIDYDLSLMEPLNIPASWGLYLTVRKVYYLWLIFNNLG